MFEHTVKCASLFSCLPKAPSGGFNRELNGQQLGRRGQEGLPGRGRDFGKEQRHRRFASETRRKSDGRTVLSDKDESRQIFVSSRTA